MNLTEHEKEIIESFIGWRNIESKCSSCPVKNECYADNRGTTCASFLVESFEKEVK